MNQRMTLRKTEPLEREGGVDTELLGRVINSPLKITIEGVDDTGEVFITSTFRSLGLSKNDLVNSMPLIRSRFFTDFVCELLIRYNIDELIKYISEHIDATQYLSMVSSTRHDYSGLAIPEDQEALRFKFHISFIQQILSEDINQLVK